MSTIPTISNPTKLKTAVAKYEKTITNPEGKSITFGFKTFTHVQSMSEETECFTAEGVVEGKLVFRAENRGHGGCTDIYPVMPYELSKPILEKLEAFCKAMPNLQFGKEMQESHPNGYPCRFESIIDNFVDEILQEKDNEKHVRRLKKQMETKTLARYADTQSGCYSIWNFEWKTNKVALKEAIGKNQPKHSILNEELEKNPNFDILGWLFPKS